jgi:DNA-binding MarR family transcriptional regulator
LLLADLYMLVVGFGLGFVMQVLVLAVQNAVDYANLGVATSTATLFRSIGGTVGVPIFGAIFANKLASNLSDKLPAAAAGALPSRLGPAQIDALPPPIREAYVAAYAAALRPIFLIAAAISVVAFLVAWLLEERPLRQTVADQQIRDSFAAPREVTSLAELETRLSTLARKQNRHVVYDQLAAETGLDLPAPQAWLLLRAADRECATDSELADEIGLPRHELAALIEDLRRRSLVEPGRPRPTPEGAAAAERMRARSREQVGELLADWDPAEHVEVRQLIQRYADVFTASPPLAAAPA